MKRLTALSLGILVISSLCLLNAAAREPTCGQMQGEQPTPVPYRQLIYEGSVLLDKEWNKSHELYACKRVEVPIPGPGYIWYEYDAYRPECPDHSCWCAYGGGVNFFIRDTGGQELNFWEWTDGGVVVVDTCMCVSSNIDPYPYRSDFKIYWDPDTDGDRVPDYKDKCPNTPSGEPYTEYEDGCPPPTPEPSPTPACELELYVSPQEIAPGETVFLELRAFRGGEPIAGTAAMVEIVDGPGTIVAGANATDEHGEASFTYQAPADISEQVVVELQGMVGECPDDVAGAYITLQPLVFPTSTPTPLPAEAGIRLAVADTASTGRPYLAVAADGVTRLRLVAHLSGPVTPEQVSWELTSESEREPGILRYVESTSADTSVRDFEPWEVFDAPYAVRVTVKASTPDGRVVSDDIVVQVVRTPVVLVHGIWSNRSAMTAVAWALKHTGQFEFYAVDYGSSPKKSSQDMRTSVKYLAEGIERLLNRLDGRGIKVSRVDVVAHSMGGLLSRLYIVGDGKSISPHPDRVRRLVTLATPHGGSHVADWYTDLIANRSVVCDGDPERFVESKVTENEINWFIAEIRKRADLASDALEFGEAVRQMQTAGNPGSVVSLLADRQARVSVGTSYYVIAGSRPLISWPRKVGGYDAIRLAYTGWEGPCGETWRLAMEDMVKEFLELVTTSDSDGVVLTASALATGTGIQPESTCVVPANHFDITGNGWALEEVLNYLTDHQVRLSAGMVVISHSPGHLHVYDAEGRHVGLTGSGVEIGIERAEYESFTDAAGSHELIWVPQYENLTVRFRAEKEGMAGLDISQGRDDGLYWFSYTDIKVMPGSDVTIDLTSPDPVGNVVHADGSKSLLSPAHTAFDPAPQSTGVSADRRLLVGALLFTYCGLFAITGISIAVLGVVWRRPLARWMLILLGGLAFLTVAVTCLFIFAIGGQVR